MSDLNDDKQGIDARAILQTVLMHKWIVLTVFIVFSGIVSYYSLSKPTLYRSSALLFFDNGLSNLAFANVPQQQKIALGSQDFGYYEVIITTDLFNQRFRKELERVVLSERNDAETVTALKSVSSSQVTLKPYKEVEQFIEISAVNYDSFLVKKMIEVTTDVLKSRVTELDREGLQRSIEFIDEQVEVTRNNLEKTEVELQALQKKTDVNIKQSEGPLAKVLLMKEKLAEFETQIQIRSSNINALNSQLDSIQRRLTGSSSYAAAETSEEKQIKLQIEQLTSQKAVLYEKLGSDAVENPEVQRIDRQIADLRSQYYTLLSSVKTGSDNTVSGDMSQVWKTIWDKKNTEEIELFLLKGQARLFSGLLTNFEKKNPNLLQDAIDISRLLRLKQVYEERLSSLIKQKESLSIQYYGSTGSLKIIDPAKEPVAIYNKVFTNIFVGTVLGLIIGIAIAVGLEFMDNRIKSIAAISSVTSIAVVGRIPPINVGDEDNAVEGLRKKINKIKTKDEEEDKNEIRRKAMISQFNPRSFVSERYRSLRTNIQFANIDSPIRSLLVASAGPGEGKTTTAVNLAISFADMGHRVCIVDTDLRKAKHHMLFDIQEQPGLTDIILGQTDLDTALQKTSINNLHSLTVGRDAKDHSEIFSSLRMNFMMNELEKKFDIVVYDTAPVMLLTDSVILASKVDAVLMVVKHAVTPKSQLQNAIHNLKGVRANIIGIVMNDYADERKNYYKYAYDGYYLSKSQRINTSEEGVKA